jgi:hypothetical protein
LRPVFGIREAERIPTTALASPMIENATRQSRLERQDFRSRLRRLPQTKITMPDINRVRRDHVIFVRPALFAPVFVTLRRGHNTRRTVAVVIHIQAGTRSYAIFR